jgi:YVTN family beta-propeller protein
MARRVPAVALAVLSLHVLTQPGSPAAAAAPAQQKLYVTNSAGDDVTVIDLATNKPIGAIKVGLHPHGIASPFDQSFLLVTVEGVDPGQLVWIDPATDKITRRMEVGPEPNQLAVTPDGKIAYVPVKDGRWQVIDLEKAKIIEEIYVGGRPHNTVCSPDGKRMYLAPMGDPKKVVIADATTHKPVGEIPFSSVVRPIALSKDEKRLFAEVDGLVGFEMADVAERKMIQRVKDDLTEEETKQDSRSHGIGIRPDQKELWECDVEHHEVHVFDISGDKPKQTNTIPLGEAVYWLTFAPDGKTCYVAVRGHDEVAVVDTATKKVMDRIAVGKAPKRLLVVATK